MGKLNVIGLGYIGLPTALMFAANGVEVVGTDLNEKLVSTLNEGKLTFEEDGLEDVFNKALDKGIEFKTEYEKTNKYIITVPTPYMALSKQIDAKYVIAATKQVLEVCEPNTILVIESTISPGTIDKFVRPIIEERGLKIGKDISVVGFDGMDISEFYNPGITTVKQPKREIALKSIELLFDLLKGECENKHLVLETELIERESCGNIIK